MAYFLESSALVKRYVDEPRGSVWMRNLTDPAHGHVLYVSVLTRIEIPSAL